MEHVFHFLPKEECNGRRIFGALACLKMCLPSHLLHSLAWYVELWDESYFLSSFIPRSLTIQHCCWYVWNCSRSFLWPGLVSLGCPLPSLIIWEGPWWDPWCVLVDWRLMFLHLDDICFPTLLFFSLKLWLDRCLTLSVDLLSLFILSIPFSILFYNISFFLPLFYFLISSYDYFWMHLQRKLGFLCKFSSVPCGIHFLRVSILLL